MLSSGDKILIKSRWDVKDFFARRLIKNFPARMGKGSTGQFSANVANDRLARSSRRRSSQTAHNIAAVAITDLDKYSIQMPYLLFRPYHLM